MNAPDPVTAASIGSVLIVEDHHDAVEVLRLVVRDTFASAEIHSTSTIAGATGLLESTEFDLALLDIGLPDGNGVELVRHINLHHPQTLCVVTTIFDDDRHLFDALRAGANGYLLKGYSSSELKLYLQDLLAGKPALSPGIAQSILLFFKEGATTAASQDAREELQTLTRRETEILKLVAHGARSKEVADRLHISTNTVAQHIKNLYAKLNVHNRAEAAVAALKMNIL